MQADSFRNHLHALVATVAVGLVVASPVSAQRVSPSTPVEELQQGEFVWNPGAAPEGPLVVLVSLSDQRAFVYRNGILIGYTDVSTGPPGHETSTGVFTVLQKDKDHVSSIYNAKMPYTERLTWSGIALHAGGLPGYPSSHGCIHLPLEFSSLLFEINDLGGTVIIADEHNGPLESAHPGMVLSPDLEDHGSGAVKRLEIIWEPERSPSGPLTVMISGGDARLYVYRNGLEIGSSQITLADPKSLLHEGVFTVLEGNGERESPFAVGKPDHRWMVVPMSDSELAVGDEIAELRSRVHIPPYLGAKIYEVLVPGSTLVISNRAAAPPVGSQTDFVIMATHPTEDESE